jgi:hypothetical protein
MAEQPNEQAGNLFVVCELLYVDAYASAIRSASTNHIFLRNIHNILYTYSEIA